MKLYQAVHRLSLGSLSTDSGLRFAAHDVHRTGRRRKRFGLLDTVFPSRAPHVSHRTSNSVRPGLLRSSFLHSIGLPPDMSEFAQTISHRPTYRPSVGNNEPSFRTSAVGEARTL